MRNRVSKDSRVAAEPMSRAQYVACRIEMYGYGDLTPNAADDEGTVWYKQALLPPERVPVCAKCSLDLKTFPRREDLKARFKFECSSPACLWHDWFEMRRPPDFQKWRTAARHRDVVTGKC